MKFPNYKNANLNLIHSILHHYGVTTKRNGLEIIDNLLNKKNYKKIILLVMDGMGHHNILQHRKDSVLSRNDYGPISTIFPSTTAAVMTMYESAMPVFESGWVSWSTYFKSINKSIDLFTGRESLTQEVVNFDYKNLIKYESIYEKIKMENPKLDLYELYPEKIYRKNGNHYQLKYTSIIDMIDKLTNLTIDNKEKFIFAYCDQPDSAMHVYGPSSNEVKIIMDEFIDLIEVYKKNIDEDTLMIISADHGQVEITKTYYLNEYPSLMEMLVMPPLLEGRVRSFYVKNQYLDKFPELFKNLFGDNFVLFTREQALELNLFGDGNQHKLFIDSIGDYIAIAVKNAVLDYVSPYISSDGFVFKGHHAGLCKEEMEVPLIIIKKDDIND